MKGLKKIIKAIKKFFRGIFNFIDKVFVTPITKFGLFIGEKTDTGAGKFEKWLNKKNTLVFISLLMALLLFFYVDNQASTVDRKSTRLNSSHTDSSRMPSSA